jgi:hypothetical protein
MGVVDNDENGDVQFRSGSLFAAMASVDRGPIFLMICTNFFVTLYVGVDALIALKIMHTAYLEYLIFVFLQLVYVSPRPFWRTSSIGAPVCL